MSDKSQGVGCLVAVGLGAVCVRCGCLGTWGFALSSVLHVSPKGDHVVA